MYAMCVIQMSVALGDFAFLFFRKRLLPLIKPFMKTFINIYLRVLKQYLYAFDFVFFRQRSLPCKNDC